MIDAGFAAMEYVQVRAADGTTIYLNDDVSGNNDEGICDRLVGYGFNAGERKRFQAIGCFRCCC